MQIELNRPAKPGHRAPMAARTPRVPGTLSRRELRRLVADMVD